MRIRKMDSNGLYTANAQYCNHFVTVHGAKQMVVNIERRVPERITASQAIVLLVLS